MAVTQLSVRKSPPHQVGGDTGDVWPGEGHHTVTHHHGRDVAPTGEVRTTRATVSHCLVSPGSWSCLSLSLSLVHLLHDGLGLAGNSKSPTVWHESCFGIMNLIEPWVVGKFINNDFFLFSFPPAFYCILHVGIMVKNLLGITVLIILTLIIPAFRYVFHSR